MASSSSLSLLSGLLAAYGALAQHRALSTYRGLPALTAGEPRQRRLVSIVVPARNEARNLGRLLPTLGALSYRPREVVVVDDDSSDGTAAVAAAHGARVVPTGGPPPPGWVGKPRACQLGAEAARGDWLLFVDADTRHAPASLSSALARAERDRLDALSLLLDQELGGFWERLVLPFAYAGYFAGVSTVNTGPADALVNGQYLLVRRSAYEAAGGHAAVAASLVEDVALGVALTRSGGRIGLLRANGQVSVRMYRQASALFEGFAKNSLAFARLQPGRGLRVALATAGATGALPAAVAAARRRPALAACQLALALSAHARWAEQFGAPPAYGLLQPLAGLAFLAVVLRGAVAALGGPGVTWKGRRYRP
jgi:chlorobactene glucosyltransferase